MRDVFEKFEDFDLVGKEVFMHLSFDEPEIDHLDCHLLICIDICLYL